MAPFDVIVRNEVVNDMTEMTHADRDHVAQALLLGGAHEALSEGVQVGARAGKPHDLHPRIDERRSERARVERVTIDTSNPPAGLCDRVGGEFDGVRKRRRGGFRRRGPMCTSSPATLSAAIARVWLPTGHRHVKPSHVRISSLLPALTVGDGVV